jgi:hypothetical protein
MNATIAATLPSLTLLSLGGTLAHARPASALGAPPTANPQPLPPRPIDNLARIAINPQLLPPRGTDSAVHRAESKATTLGGTEENRR